MDSAHQRVPCTVYGTQKPYFLATIHTFKNYFATVFSVFSKINCIQTDPKFLVILFLLFAFFTNASFNMYVRCISVCRTPCVCQVLWYQSWSLQYIFLLFSKSCLGFSIIGKWKSKRRFLYQTPTSPILNSHYPKLWLPIKFLWSYQTKQMLKIGTRKKEIN